MFSVYTDVSSEPATISLTSSPFSSIMAGDTVTLTCSLTLPHEVTGTPDFQWEGPGGVPLTPAASMTSGQTVSSDLPLNEITTSQAGQYNCTATLSGSITTSTTITVESEFSRALSSMILPLPTLSVPAPTPEITASVTGTVSAGAPLNLTCDYTLSPSVDTDPTDRGDLDCQWLSS